MNYRKTVYNLILFSGSLLVFLVLVIFSCEKLELNRVTKVQTESITGITQTSCNVQGIIIEKGEEGITQHGHCWSATENPSTSDSITQLGSKSSTGSFTSNLTGLTANTKYYIRAYATDHEGTSYGSEISFTTLTAAVPSVITNAATNVTETTVTLNGTVNANGQSTTVTFEYGPTTSYGSTFTASQSPVTGSVNTNVSAAVSGLTANTTYHFRVKAVSTAGTNYGSDQTFTTKTSGQCTAFEVTHTAGDVAPVTKTVNYGTVETNLSGENKCWITQNLGADNQAGSATNATEAAAGWYWQFNRKQGYKHNGSTRTPGTTWITSIDEASNWTADNDPCIILLGTDWRIPTETEWTNADNSGGWNNYNDTYASVLKLHAAGVLDYDYGSLISCGSSGSFWSSMQGNNTSGLSIYFESGYSGINYASKAFGMSVRCLKEEIAVVPTLTTTAVTSITATTASSGGNITDDGGASVAARGVCWSTSQNPTVADSHTTDGSGTGSFASSLTGLTASTTYYVRAYATNSAGTAYGNELSFTTSAVITVVPILSTTAIKSITATTASSGGNITDDGGASVTARGVCWNTSANPTTANTKTINGSGTGSFTSSITGLSTGTLYYVRAYATNSAGTAYGNELSFTTSAVTPVVPTLTTTAVTSITTTIASSGGNITSDGGASVTARGVCWNTSANPTITNSNTSDGSGIGSFVSSLTGLYGNTTYYVRAYATNSIGTAYGNQVSFETANSSVTIMKSFSVPGSSPTAIESDSVSLWMIDNLNNFYHLDTVGNVLSTFPFHTEVYDLAWDGDGLWAYTYSQLEQIDTNGNILSVLPISYWPGSGIAWDGTYFWISDYNFGTIYKHDHAGNLILTFETIFFGHPTGMAYNGSDLLIGDSFEAYNKIYLYSKTGIEKSSVSLDEIDLQKIKTFEKKALAWDGNYIWYSSNARFEIYKLKIDW